ncbi:MAG: hypothetical protein ACC613_03665 [Synergistales bacterium]
MEVHLVLCSKFDWVGGEELAEEEACRVFADPWDACFAFQGDPDKAFCICISNVTTTPVPPSGSG